MKVSANITALAEELGIPRVRLYGWRRRLDAQWPAAAESYRPRDEEKITLQQQLREINQLLAEKTREVDFFKGALQKIGARRQKSEKTGGAATSNKNRGGCWGTGVSGSSACGGWGGGARAGFSGSWGRG